LRIPPYQFILLDVSRASKHANHWMRFAQILCSEGDGCLRSNRERVSFLSNGFFENEIRARFVTRRN